MVIMHPHPSPLASRERGNWMESMSIFGFQIKTVPSIKRLAVSIAECRLRLPVGRGGWGDLLPLPDPLNPVESVDTTPNPAH